MQTVKIYIPTDTALYATEVEAEEVAIKPWEGSDTIVTLYLHEGIESSGPGMYRVNPNYRSITEGSTGFAVSQNIALSSEDLIHRVTKILTGITEDEWYATLMKTHAAHDRDNAIPITLEVKT